jgi:hypothetical protein
MSSLRLCLSSRVRAPTLAQLNRLVKHLGAHDTTLPENRVPAKTFEAALEGDFALKATSLELARVTAQRLQNCAVTLAGSC